MPNIFIYNIERKHKELIRSFHLAKLKTAIPTHSTETKGLNLSPMTAALLIIPLKPVLWGSMKDGQAALMYEAVQMKKSTTIIILSKLKKAL
jgi:hypothetical protein